MSFSREPAVWVGTIGTALTLAASLGVPFLDAGAAAAFTVFLSSLVMAIYTRPVAPALAVGALSALVSVFAEYGLHWSDAQIGAAGGFLLGIFALFGVRPQVDPTDRSGRVVEGKLVQGASAPR